MASGQEKTARRAPSLLLLNSNDSNGDILVQDVMVPSEGLAKCTYYCCMNWNSGKVTINCHNLTEDQISDFSFRY